MNKTVEYKKFQQASIEAIYKHYEVYNNKRALCADEAGLGKTYIARGVIEKLAYKKIEDIGISEYKISLKNWARNFYKEMNDKDTKLKFSGGGIGHIRVLAIKTFISKIAKKEIELECGRKANLCKLFKECIEIAIEDLSNPDKIIEFLKALIDLYTFAQEHNSNKEESKWKTPLQLPEAYRVLYVCCNLAIADQNTKKLVPLKQRSYISAKDKPDRLSTLGYYIEKYPTPYIEILPITATIIGSNTLGTKNEKKILAEDNLKDEPSIREKAEKESLEKWNPDLIIFDEFQNFGDMIHLIEMDDDKFNKYLDQLASNLDADGEENSNEDEKKQLEKSLKNRKRALERYRKICKQFQDKKMLFLSASPFHKTELIDNSSNINQLELKQLLDFLKPNSSKKYNNAIMQKNYQDVERILYEECGIFRNERIQLMKKNNMAYHIIQCSGSGLLERAVENGNGIGKRATGIINTTPRFEDVKTIYSHVYYSTSRMSRIGQYTSLNITHSRYERLKDIIYAVNEDDVTETDCKYEMNADEMRKLLWIPPVRTNTRLGGVFAKYISFSKSLVFSNLLVTPYSVCTALNDEIGNQSLKMDNKVKGEVRSWLCDNIFEEEETADSFLSYLEANGKAAFEGKLTTNNIIKYCKDGALKDVIVEYMALGYMEKDIRDLFYDKSKNINKYCRFAYDMKMEDLEVSTSKTSIRKSFNSPFYPFVLMTTSIGSEGLDFHLYCNRLIHYTLPTNVAQLEQKNGRIDRKNSLAQRKWWATLPNEYYLNQHKESLENNSGGMIPDWDAGENNLHYFFLYTKFTREKEKLDMLLKEKEKYRKTIGVNMVLEEDTFNLCPYLR